ncbi:hypothetical protein V7150_22285 [Neobacillus drentensis]|uniref:hypothetical protein n=1 Tax=Neobacillus drentensis TaxID=220684 RepID=UPI002FFE7ABB
MSVTLVMNILLILFIFISLYITFKYIRYMLPLPGFTVYKSSRLILEYPFVDLEKKEVTGTVSFKNNICMTVIVNLQSNSVKVVGSIENTCKGQKDIDYIDMIKKQAEFFVANKISNPKKYYEQII